jgi:hypothetical protein
MIPENGPFAVVSEVISAGRLPLFVGCNFEDEIDFQIW